MTRVRASAVGVLSALLLVLPRPALAQNNAGEFSAGWQLLHFDEETFSRGWYADALGNITSSIGVVGEVAGNYRTIDETRVVSGIPVNVSADLRIHSFMGGARVSARQNPRIVAFGQALIGMVHGSASIEGSTTVAGRTFSVDDSESDSEFAFELGGGVNLAMTDDIGVRFAATYFRVVEEDASNSVRFAVGVVFPF
jgi:opacity protein-like surface antigen